MAHTWNSQSSGKMMRSSSRVPVVLHQLINGKYLELAIIREDDEILLQGASGALSAD
jgi:hypothetical protein